METFPNEKYDLFGDETVILFPLHGHSAGMTGIKVGTKEKYLIIAGDGGYGRPSWEDLILPGVEWNRKEAMRSLKQLQKYGNDKHCQAILMTHDTEMKTKIFEL